MDTSISTRPHVRAVPCVTKKEGPVECESTGPYRRESGGPDDASVPLSPEEKASPPPLPGRYALSQWCPEDPRTSICRAFSV